MKLIDTHSSQIAVASSMILLMVAHHHHARQQHNVLLTCLLALALCLMVTGASSSESNLGGVAGPTTVRDSEANTGTDTLSGDSPIRRSDVVVVRLYLIRHGETRANQKGLVLGQTDSVRWRYMHTFAAWCFSHCLHSP